MLGVVVIGRNEGGRLKRCLGSLRDQAVDAIVYVDSGSSDGSIEFAESLGVAVVNLDMSQPFTMARGRNAGFAYLREQCSALRYVQFVDGDCEVAAGWFEAALEAIQKQNRVAVVCGRRRERFPDASIYNRLADMEWNGPVGEVKACGGDALLRVSAMIQVGGFNPELIAGEEPELCVRLRHSGWTVLRIEREMTVHDAAMTRFGQWWKRAKRTGHAYAEGMALHGRAPEFHCRRQTWSALVYGLLVPMVAIGAFLLLLTGREAIAPASVALFIVLLAYVRIAWSAARDGRPRGERPTHACLYALFTVMAKVPQCSGALTYYWNRVRGNRATLIEYKTS